MIVLNSKLCDVMDLTYWQLKENKTNTTEQVAYRLTRDEKELLRKILLAKSIKLSEDILEIKEHSVAVLNLSKWQLVFDDVTCPDSNKIIHLSKLSVMLEDSEQKKLTWHKLKNISLN